MSVPRSARANLVRNRRLKESSRNFWMGCPPMRTKFNLNLATLDHFTVLLQGVYIVGKTHLLGDMLRYESQFGPVRFCNSEGEDGWMTISGMNLGEIGETVQNYKDMLDYHADGCGYRGCNGSLGQDGD